MSNISWDDYFKSLCLAVAAKSKDPSTKVGCVIASPDHEVRSTGYNGFPRGVIDHYVPNPEPFARLKNEDIEKRYQRPQKYFWTEHSERNAIFSAARCGTSLDGCTLYCVSIPVPFPCCHDCARAIIQSGIREVVFDYTIIPEQWKESCEVALIMFKEAGVNVRKFKTSECKS